MIYLVEISRESFGELGSKRKTMRCDVGTLVKALRHPNITVWSAHYADEKIDPVGRYELLRL